MRFQTSRTTIACEDAGHGTPVLLIHGFPLDREMWNDQLRGLSASARVIAPDLRGFGESGPPPDVMPMEDYATDLAELLEILAVDRAVVCGLSMGGYVALAFHARFPERTAGLVLANTRAGADSDAARAARLQNVKRAYAEGAGAIADAMLPKMLTDATRAARPALASGVRAMMARQTPDGLAAALRGMAARQDRTADLAGIAVPTLVVTGDADTLIPPSESALIAAAVPNARLVTIPGAAHLSNVERPEAFNAAVASFLGTIQPPR